jgi:acetyltransferase-like isoleucine patch superfamily enzyme
VGRETWLRCEVEKIRLVAYSGGRLTVAAECFLNGCQLSAKERVEVARGAMIGPGCRVYDSDQHPLDESTPERPKPVEIGECSWIASDVTVSKGSVIGEHSVIGTRSLVAGQIDAHTLAYGVPAVPRASVGKRRPFL